MNITISQEQASVLVTVIHLQGKLDGSNYKALIAKAQEIYTNGVHDLLIDLSGVDFMSSAGMVALHSIARLLKGHPLGDEEGWSLLHSVERERSSGPQKQLKLLNPQPKVAQSLEIAGFDQIFAIYPDLKLALASF